MSDNVKGWEDYDGPLQPGEHRITPDGREVWMDEKKAVWVKVDGETYPLGLEPKEDLSPEELARARRKEQGNIFALRIAGFGLIIMVLLVLFFVLTK